MDFYYGRNSGNSARAAFGLFESGASFDPRQLNIKANQNHEPAYLAINPMGKIPALVDEGIVLWESNAINWYVAERHPASGLLPDNIEGRAAVQRWLFFQTAHVSPGCTPVFRATNPRSRAAFGEPDPRDVQRGRTELERFLPVLDRQLEGRDWLERKFSMADIAHTPHLVMLAAGGFDFSPYPRLAAWLERVQARPGWRKASELIYGPP